jgi:AraC-like DNA-binding protein
MGTEQTVDTDDVAPAERVDYWRDVVSDQYVPLAVRPQDGPALRGRIVAHGVGALQLRSMRASAHAFDRTPQLLRRSADEYYKIALVTSGSSVLSQDDREVALAPGVLALYDSSRPYTFRMPDDFGIIVCMLPKRLLPVREDLLGAATARPVDARRGVGALLPGHLRQLAEHAAGFTPDESAALVASTAELIAAVVAGRSRGHLGESLGPSMLDQVKRHIAEHLADRELDPTAIAAAHAISVSYLHRLFAGTGTTVSGWIREQRLTACWRLLGSPRYAHLSVTAIGALCGLPEPAHLSRAFRARFGITPRERRAQGPRA